MTKLHCFAQSGNSYKVAFMLNALGVPWTPVFVDYFGGETRSPKYRAEVNEMGEAPVLVDSEVTLSQSGVILDYLAQKHARFGGRTDAEKREVLRWVLFDNHKFTSFFATLRFMKSFAPAAPDPAVLGFLRARAEAAYDIVNTHLGRQPFMAGDEVTVADFSFSGYVFYPLEESGFDIAARYPHIEAWRQRLMALPGWASPYDVLPGERMAPKW
jgi:glutathione S-transferase